MDESYKESKTYVRIILKKYFKNQVAKFKKGNEKYHNKDFSIVAHVVAKLNKMEFELVKGYFTGSENYKYAERKYNISQSTYYVTIRHTVSKIQKLIKIRSKS